MYHQMTKQQLLNVMTAKLPVHRLIQGHYGYVNSVNRVEDRTGRSFLFNMTCFRYNPATGIDEHYPATICVQTID
jgi:hypothetical protein